MAKTRPLDDFEIEDIALWLGGMGALTRHDDDANAKRIRSRLRRFVESHPLVTKRHMRLFRAELSKRYDDGLLPAERYPDTVTVVHREVHSE